jgi:hypothetical protein
MLKRLTPVRAVGPYGDKLINMVESKDGPYVEYDEHMWFYEVFKILNTRFKGILSLTQITNIGFACIEQVMEEYQSKEEMLHNLNKELVDLDNYGMSISYWFASLFVWNETYKDESYWTEIFYYLKGLK